MAESTKARAVGFNHVALEVGDIEAALAFYGRLFSFELRSKSDVDAFIDLGDQFIALEAGRTQPPDGGRHIGLVVDDQQAAVERAREAGAQMIGSHDFLDPWGNHWQVVDYRDVQFAKTDRVLEGMELPELEKSERARRELRDKGLAD